MCFSATASFSASTILGVMGIISLISSLRKPRLRYIALMPLLFAAQQATEGFLWLALTDPDNRWLRWLMPISPTLAIERLAWLYLLFAYVVWPFWIPTSLYMAEKKAWQKRLLLALAICGTVGSLYLLYTMFLENVSAFLVQHHIAYYPISHVSLAEILLYGCATIVPFFVSSLWYSRLLGVVILSSCITSYMLWYTTFTSVWCFFASLLSIFTILVVRKNK